jgi:hypothetical protein
VDGVTGADGEDVMVVEHADVSAVVEPIPDAGDVPATRFVRAHARVLDGIAARCAVLPVRFGTVLASRDAVVQELLAPDQSRLLAMLAELQGRVQLILRARYVLETVLAEVVRENPDITTLRERTRSLPDEAGFADRVRLGELVSQAMDTKRAADREVVLGAVQPHVERWSVRRSGGLEGVLDLAVLVDAQALPELEEHTRAAAERTAGRVDLQLVGPMAPYDFATERV